jgi:5-(carboxyamino)imidazole ribonucleotide synthase
LCTILLWETLWSTKSISPSMMINLLWPEDHVWDYGLKDAQALEKYENVHIHMYGKQPSKPNRKLGHITLTAISLESLLTLYKEIEHLLYLVPIHD